MRTLKITFKNHLLNSGWTLSYFVGMGLFVSYIYGENSVNDNPFILAAGILVMTPSILACAWIHYSYYLENSGDEFKVYPDKIVDVKRHRIYSVSEMKKIIVHKSGVDYRVGFLNEYKYCKVVMNSGKPMILTSLLHYNIDEFLKENLKGVLFERDDAFFAHFI